MDSQGIENNYTSFKFPKRVVQAYFQEIFKTISPDLRVFRTNQGIIRGSIQGFSGDYEHFPRLSSPSGLFMFIFRKYSKP